jgi:gamma-butyrobetaine dioxygenase
MSVAEAVLEGDVVVVSTDREPVALHRYLLRDGCPCEECRHPVSGQRLFESARVVPDAHPVDVRATALGVDIVWADGHASSYPTAWIEAHTRKRRKRGRAVHWGAELAEQLPGAPYEDVLRDADSRARWLGDVAAYGFSLLSGVPIGEGVVAEVAELFGHVRVTNYGRYFDVRVRVDAANLADTALGLSLHTDNPYRVPAPTLQLLHCLSSDVEGGETLLADGFRAAEMLREHSPRSFEVLSTVPIEFAYRDDTAELASRVPVILLDTAGEPQALHINNRSKGEPSGRPGEVAEWYDAYFELLELLDAPEARVQLRMEQGDLLLFDNLRVLHGRTSFRGTGNRRLQGCYADRDGLLSTLAILQRTETL